MIRITWLTQLNISGTLYIFWSQTLTAGERLISHQSFGLPYLGSCVCGRMSSLLPNRQVVSDWPNSKSWQHRPDRQNSANRPQYFYILPPPPPLLFSTTRITNHLWINLSKKRGSAVQAFSKENVFCSPLIWPHFETAASHFYDAPVTTITTHKGSVKLNFSDCGTYPTTITTSR